MRRAAREDEIHGNLFVQCERSFEKGRNYLRRIKRCVRAFSSPVITPEKILVFENIHHGRDAAVGCASSECPDGIALAAHLFGNTQLLLISDASADQSQAGF